MADNITQVLQELDLIDSSYDRRRKIEALAEEHLFSVTATAKEIERNYSYVRVDGYRDGYALLGTVQGVSSEVKILLPAALSDQATRWNTGEEKSFIVKLYDWDGAYKHFKLLATEVVSAQPEPTAQTPEETTPSVPIPEQPSEAESPPIEEVGEQSPILQPAESNTESQQAPTTESVVAAPESAQAPSTKLDSPQEEEVDELPSTQQSARPLESTGFETEQSAPSPTEPDLPAKAPESPTSFSTLEQTDNPLQLPEPVPPAAKPAATKAPPTVPPAPEPPPVMPPATPPHYQQTPVQLSRYSPPTLSKVPIIERVQTFGGRTKPMSPLVGSQRFSQQPVNPFEIVQGEFRKPFMLGLKIFGGIFAAFLLLTCICCGILSR